MNKPSSGYQHVHKCATEEVALRLSQIQRQVRRTRHVKYPRLDDIASTASCCIAVLTTPRQARLRLLVFDVETSPVKQQI